MADNISTLGDLIDRTEGSIQTGPFGTKLKASEYTPTGVPVISVGEVGHGRIRLHAKTPRVDESIWKRMPEYLLQAGDIVFGRKGAVERSAQVQPAEDGYFLGSDGIRVRLNPDACHPKFIAYQFQSALHKNWMIQHAAGSTMPSLNEGILRRIPVILPPLPEQKAIAHILGSLDDKIELNRRMNETLEGMAQALFKSWFVDFDPVIDNALEAGNPIPEPFAARAEVRRNVMAGSADVPVGTSIKKGNGANEDVGTPRTLFPAAFHETKELGWIPEGWAAGKISDLCDAVQSGGTPKRAVPEYWNGSIKWLSSGEVREVIALSTKETITQLGVDKSAAKIWPKHTTVIAMYGATAGQVCFLATDMTANQACCALIPTSVSKSFVFMASRRSSDLLLEQATGSAQQNLNKSLVANNPTIIPPEGILNTYESSTFPLIDKWISNLKENAALTNLRDTLLPKLISGELRIEEAKKMVENEDE